jgi:spore coat polysaccharide biosynthesis protein SpsF
MSRTMAVVQPKEVAPGTKTSYARRLGGQSLLERLVRRLTDCERLDGVVVVIPNDAQAESIADLVPRDVPVYVSKRPDSLGRLCDVVDCYRPDAVVQVPACRLFVDPNLVDRLVITAADHPSFDYIGYCSRDGRPSILSPLGVFTEWCASDAIRRAESLAVTRKDRDQPTRFLYSHPELFRLRLLPAPAELDRDDLRLTVDHEEDWHHLHTFFDVLGAEGFDWRRIAELLDQHPAVRQRMATLNRTPAAA